MTDKKKNTPKETGKLRIAKFHKGRDRSSQAPNDDSVDPDTWEFLHYDGVELTYQTTQDAVKSLKTIGEPDTVYRILQVTKEVVVTQQTLNLVRETMSK